MRISLSWFGRPRPVRRRRWTAGLTVEELEARRLPSFIAGVSLDAGSYPAAVAVGDFNGDGIQDLAVVDSAALGGTPGVSVMLGNGDGSFQPAQTFTAGVNPTVVAVGDFNGDGIQDLAVADNIGANSPIAILLGNGDGSFQPPRTFATRGSFPNALVVGDLNGDGVPDLVVANSSGLDILRGRGDGTFQAPLVVNSSSSFGVVIADFNGDGIPDLATAVQNNNDVAVLLGNGDGSFQPARNYFAGSSPSFVAVGDFNGDGIPDLAVPNSIGIGILLGNGDGSFQPPRNTTGGPGFVVMADMNGDGIPDLVMPNGLRNHTVTVALGNGDGSFQAPQSFATGQGSVALAVGDFNGDGIPDLATANYSGDDVTVLLGNGDGSFPDTPPGIAVGSRPTAVAVGDFNGDGIPDLAVANEGSGTVSVLLGNGDGSFQPARNYPAGSAPVAVTVGDFNGDGILDLATNGAVLLGNGDGTFQPAQTFDAGMGPNSLVVGDFNGDGILDLAVAGFQCVKDACSDPSIRLLLGNGDGTFQPARRFTESFPYALVEGDFNGDSIPDLAFAFQGSHGLPPRGIAVLLGKGDGTFQPERTFTESASSSVLVGDVNGDGIPDLVIGHAGSPSSVDVRLGVGDGTFQPAQTFLTGSNPFPMALGDFNGDGIPDLAAIVAGGAAIYLGIGDGTFQTSAAHYLAGSMPSSLAAADFNSDGYPDLAVTNAGSNDVSILLNDGLWPAGPRGSTRPALPTHSVHRPTHSGALLAAATAVRSLSGPVAVPVQGFVGPASTRRPEHDWVAFASLLADTNQRCPSAVAAAWSGNGGANLSRRDRSSADLGDPLPTRERVADLSLEV